VHILGLCIRPGGSGGRKRNQCIPRGVERSISFDAGRCEAVRTVEDNVMMLDPLFDMLFSSWGPSPRAVCDFFFSVPVLKLIHLSLSVRARSRALAIRWRGIVSPGHDPPHRMLKGGGVRYACRTAHLYIPLGTFFRFLRVSGARRLEEVTGRQPSSRASSDDYCESSGC
jgi:hypothetical protein